MLLFAVSARYAIGTRLVALLSVCASVIAILIVREYRLLLVLAVAVWVVLMVVVMLGIWSANRGTKL